MSAASSGATAPDETPPEMRVVASLPGAWYLLRCGVDLFLDGRYGAGHVDGTIFFRLNSDEKARYEQRGDGCLGELQFKIDDQMLWWTDDQFLWRDLSRGPRSRHYQDRRARAIEEWRRANDGAGDQSG